MTFAQHITTKKFYLIEEWAFVMQWNLVGLRIILEADMNLKLGRNLIIKASETINYERNLKIEYRRI